MFHGREPIKPLDLRFNLKVLQNLETRYEFTNSIQDRMNEVFSAARDATITAYQKYRHFYDRKASASPLERHRYCLLLNPKLSNVNDHKGKSLAKWLPLYRVEQVLTNSNYIIRKVGTNYTQCVHRIRLRPITPQYKIDDLPHIHANNFIPDPSTRHSSEPAIFDNALPDLLQDKTFTPSDEISDTPSVLFYYTPRRIARPATPVLPPVLPDPPNPQVLPPAPLAGLPINPDFTLDDVILDDEPSPHPSDSSSSDENTNQFLVTHGSPPLTQPSSVDISRSRPPSHIYSSSDIHSSDSTFSGFSSTILSRADRCLNRSTYTSPGASTNTRVTYTSSRTPLRPSIRSPTPSFPMLPSRIPRPTSPVPRSFSMRPSSSFPSPPLASSTPTRTTQLSFSPTIHTQTPVVTTHTRCDSSAQTPNETLTLNERFPNVFVPSWYDTPLPQNDPGSSRDSRLRQKPRKTSFFNPKPWK